MNESIITALAAISGVAVTQIFTYYRDRRNFKDNLKIKEIEESNAVKRKKIESDIEHEYNLKEKEIEGKNEHAYFTKKFVFEVKYPIYQEIYALYKQVLGAIIPLNCEVINPSEEDLMQILHEAIKKEIFFEYLTDEQKQVEYYNYYFEKFSLLKRQLNNLISENNLIFNKHENNIFKSTTTALNTLENYITTSIEKIESKNVDRLKDYQNLFINNGNFSDYFNNLENHMYAIAELFKISLGLYWNEEEKPLSIEEVYEELSIKPENN